MKIRFFRKKKIDRYLEILSSKNDTIDLKNFFQNEVKKNIRLTFNYFNFIQDFEVLNHYFEDKKLVKVQKKEVELPFGISNITHHQPLTDVYHDLKVSIILTIYNGEKLLEVAINSLLEQSFQNMELIIVDDHSSDSSLEILKRIQRIYPEKITLICLNKNYGTYIAKNIGISYACGNLITFHDADDWAHPQRVEEHVKAHMKNKKVKFSISKLVRLSEDGYFYSKHIYPLDRLSMVSLMIDKVLLDEIGYFRKHRLGSDTEYFERLKKFTKHKFERIDKVLMFCAHRENSLTTSPETGVEGFSKNRRREHYWNQWNKWHNKLKQARRKPFIKFQREKYDYKVIR